MQSKQNDNPKLVQLKADLESSGALKKNTKLRVKNLEAYCSGDPAYFEYKFVLPV